MITQFATKTFAGVAAAAMLAMALLSPASALERRVYTFNDGWSSIYSVQIRHVGTRDWGPDLLGQHMIEVGGEFMVEPYNHQGYCMFDVKVTFDTGEAMIIENGNLCEATDIIASETGGYAFG